MTCLEEKLNTLVYFTEVSMDIAFKLYYIEYVRCEQIFSVCNTKFVYTMFLVLASSIYLKSILINSLSNIYFLILGKFFFSLFHIYTDFLEQSFNNPKF